MTLRRRLDSLLQRASRRDAVAWEAFWGIAGPRCWPTVKACAPRGEWEDVHAEVAVDIWEHADHYQPGTYPLSWVHAIARNAARKAGVAHSEACGRIWDMDTDTLAQDSDILGAVIRQAEARRALRGLKTVSASCRRAALQFAAGATTEQAAAANGFAKGRNALWTARQAMRLEAGADFMPPAHKPGDPRPLWSSANPTHQFAERCAVGHHSSGRLPRAEDGAPRPVNEGSWQA